jgi:gliding motility-associated-like protein
MNKCLQKFILTLFIVFSICSSNTAYANHLFGADFNYAWVSGNTYRITLTIYGDCAGAFNPSSSFSGLQGASPRVYIYNGFSIVDSLSLVQQGTGVEVSPVCPAQQALTSCSVPGSTIQGVKRYIYSGNYTLSGTSASWRFQFNGDLPGPVTNYIAGRSTSITNIFGPSSIMRLEATLNNTVGNNSSPAYTTIPTPFFCINKPANYNPGTVDPNTGDVLTFALVDGLEALPPSSTGGFVNYRPPYTAVAPLPAAMGTFAFNTTNGQLGFTPNLTSNSLVVSRVTETRGGVVVGTSMREMVFVVTACNNNPPTGVISNTSSSVTMINGTSVTICRNKGLFTFNVNPTDADGDVINVAATGIPAGATFTVNNNNTTSPTGLFSWNVTNVTPGTYNFFITYTDEGCPLASRQTVAYSITVLPDPRLTYTLISPATCIKKAVFSVTPIGGSAPYIINLGSVTRTGVTGTITDSLDGGTYTFTITGANSCSNDTTVTIVSPPRTTVSAQIKNSTCSTLGNGSVTLIAGGSPPFTFAQGTGAYSANNTFSPLPAGTYIFHIRDVLNCTKDTSITIRDSLVISGVITTTRVICNGQSNGEIQVRGTGGATPYTYAIGTGLFSTANIFNALAAGTYTVQVKDNLGCQSSVSATVTQPTVVGVSAVRTNVSCNGLSDGSVTLTGIGGSPGYTYAVGTGTFSTTNTFTGLAAGTYTFHVADASNCPKDTTITITQPAPLAFTLALTNVLCNGSSTGTVTVTATGGTTPYTYAANTGAFSASNVLTGLNVGTHIIHLKDANGCTKDTTITLTEPPVLGIAFTSTNPSCFAGTDGTFTITGSGGTPAYTFAVNASAFTTSGSFTGFAAGTHILHVRDANGCTKDTTVTLGQPTAITVSATIIRPRCTPLVNGTVTLAAAGGTPGYTYARGTGAYGASPIFNNLGSGTYIFHVRDSKNCVKDTLITVTDSIFVHATTVITDAKCFNEASGAVNITAFGGDSPYTYALGTNPYAATNPIINLPAGPYVLHVKDLNGCILDTNITIGQPPVISPNVTVNQPLCYLGSDGSLVMATTGGTPAYTYALGTGTFGTTASFTGLTAGTYTVHIKDNNGCTKDTTVVMGQPTELLYSFITLSHLICNGDSSGTITIRAVGATPPYSYAADVRPYQVSNIITGLRAGVHTIHLRDANGCTKDSSALLWEPTKVHVLIPEVVTPTCEGYKDGMIQIAGTGGNPGYTYSDDNITFDTQRYYVRIPEGTYTFRVKDSRGCIGDTTMDLIGYPHININNPTITDASCNGYKDGAFTLNVTGGNPPLSYFMRSPADSNRTGIFDSLVRGTYVVRIVDSTGCFKETTVVINHPDTLVAGTIITPNDCIGYDDGGAVEVTSRGGTPPYSYLWSTTPQQTAGKISGLPNGKYAVIVTDAHRCADTTIALVPYDNCCKPVIPDAFTPNGDGRNDRFRVLFKGDVKLESFSVYNRYGQRIFYTTATEAGWDGTWNDRNQDAGTYFYYIRLVCGNKGNNVQEYKGDITLIR